MPARFAWDFFPTFFYYSLFSFFFSTSTVRSFRIIFKSQKYYLVLFSLFLSPCAHLRARAGLTIQRISIAKRDFKQCSSGMIHTFVLRGERSGVWAINGSFHMQKASSRFDETHLAQYRAISRVIVEPRWPMNYEVIADLPGPIINPVASVMDTFELWTPPRSIRLDQSFCAQLSSFDDIINTIYMLIKSECLGYLLCCVNSLTRRDFLVNNVYRKLRASRISLRKLTTRSGRIPLSLFLERERERERERENILRRIFQSWLAEIIRSLIFIVTELNDAKRDDKSQFPIVAKESDRRSD